MADMANWDAQAGRVSEAFDDWRLVDVDQRTFLHIGLEFAREIYGRIWEEAGGEPADPDGPDEQIDIFERRVRGLHEHDYRWMHCSGVLRDAVTNFEVYLEKACEEIQRRQGQAVAIADRSPWWRELRDFYLRVGIDIETSDIEEVRRLRDFLVHRRGELRTAEQRAEFAPKAEGLGPLYAELDEGKVIDVMDTLGETVRRVDVEVYRYSWGGERLPK
jgi:hypothetical protein